METAHEIKNLICIDMTGEFHVPAWAGRAPRTMKCAYQPRLMRIVLNLSITLLGITVVIDSNTSYEDLNNQPILESQYFSAISEGNLVKAKWKIITSILIPVDELSFEEQRSGRVF